MYADAIIILGKHMPGGVPDTDLLARVSAATQCWIEGRAPAVIPCGGQRDGEPCAEADWMSGELMRRGVPPTVIHPERNSMNTEQNLTNAAMMLKEWGGRTALVVTSAIHLPRALAVCKSIGLAATGWPVLDEGGSRFKAHLVEWLGWIEWKLGWQRSGPPNWFAIIIRKVTRT
ncbi:hypothetical protein AGMMS49992_17970 [Clostridia bacterium]|nr:hypothetical protein AGMMS49992_17970 [Clostridia bacterium]